MEALIDTFKTIKLWQVGVLVAVLVGTAGGSYGVYTVVSGLGQADLEEDQQLIPVTRSDLVNDVSVSGNLIYSNRESLTFGTQGEVGEILVEEGDEVEEGQPLAVIDNATLASLKRSVAQATAGLQDAEEALADALDPHTALDIAQSEAKVANARLTLDEAQEALTRILEPSSQDVAQTESKVASARLTLSDAQEALDKLLEPSSLDVAQSESKVASAKISLEEAQEALDRLLEPTPEDIARAEVGVTDAKRSVENASTTLDELKSGPSDDTVAQAQSQVTSADTSLSNAGRDLELTTKEWENKVSLAQDTLDTTGTDYKGALEKWLGADISDEEIDLTPDALLESWGADLATLFDPDSRFYDLGQWLWTQGIPADDPSTPWKEPIVYTWVNLYPGDIAPTCEDGVVPFQGDCIEKEIDDTWAVYEDAKDNLDTVETQAAKALDNSQEAVTRAEDTLDDAQEALSELLEPADQLDITAAESRLVLAQQTLQDAEEDLATLESGPDAVDVEVKQAQLAIAQANLNQAEEDLVELTGDPDPLEVEAKQKQVAVALANLDQAEEDLAELTGVPDPLDMEAKQKQVAVADASLAEAEESLADITGSVDPVGVELKEAELASAQASLETAVQRLDDATIKAPWDGVVSAINVVDGQSVNANIPILEVVDLTVVEIEGSVDEIDVLYIRKGMEATVTMDALAGQTLSGTVSTLASAAVSQQGVVSYSVSISIEVPDGLDLPEGLSAVADVIIREDPDVLLVPIQALYGTYDQPVVRVMSEGSIVEREVTLGNNDGFWIIVQEGLAEGEQVVMESQQASTQTGFGAMITVGGSMMGPGFEFGGGRPPGLIRGANR